MPFVEFTTNVIAAGARRRAGERVEMEAGEARLLIGMGRARVVDGSIPVVIEPSPSDAKKSSGKRPPRRTKQESSAEAGLSQQTTDPVEETGSDASTAVE